MVTGETGTVCGTRLPRFRYTERRANLLVEAPRLDGPPSMVLTHADPPIGTAGA